MKPKKTKKSKQRMSEADKEPDILGKALSKTRKRKPDNVPSLYKEDLDEVGLKKKDVAANPSGANFSIHLTKDEKRRRKERQMRFTGDGKGTEEALVDALYAPLKSSRGSSNTKSSKQSTSSSSSLVGTCQNLEKPYLRLTTYPKPSQVRPLNVLMRSLKHIQCRYIQDEDFEWANEQLKSVRQDITVQGIKNNFVLDVYETHARILLENGDLNEYNQCQTVIRTLTSGFKHGVADLDAGSSDDFAPSQDHHSSHLTTTVLLKQCDVSADEFGGYRLLYALVQNSWTDLTRELASARSMILRVGDDSSKCCSCRNAILVVKAVTDHDYHTFFRLYKSAPYLSAYLMDFLVKRVRAGAYERIVAAYRPTISVEFFREALLFKELEETREFLRERGAVFVEERGEPTFWVDCKASK